MRDRIMLRGEQLPDIRLLDDRFDRLIERTFGRDRQAPWMPAMDVYETDDQIVVTVELPGVHAEDVEVSVEDSTLTVGGAREFSSEVEQERYRRIERRYGAFSRAVTLPPKVDTSKVDARFSDGVLTIEIPKVEKAEPTKITVKADS
ncbi:MAG TPA: Hsp20/alpha crystallin family protein [Actinomycetota bacterium]|nr:Hsp20/alpha crystallin family protein [Actinomycetota bacterium]